MIKWIVVLLVIVCVAGYANTLAVERTVKVTIDTGLGWDLQEGDNYALVSDGASYFALVSTSSTSSSASGVLSLERAGSDFVFVVSSDTQKLANRLPEMELQGFFSGSLNFISKPTNTELVFYVSNLVADVSQFNKIDVLIHKDGNEIVMEDALK